MAVFEIVVTLVKGKDADETEKVIVEPTHVTAKNRDVAVFKAARLIPAEFEDELDNVMLAVRPF